MKIKQLEDGTFVGDFQGIDGSYLELLVKDFLLKLKEDTIAKIIMDDPNTHPDVIMYINNLGCEILQNELKKGTFSIKFRR
ncbi:hypothetical protein IPdc08_01096 [archaeon]|nr:hypothetical protein IPdc08_01096 [archaeon]